MTLSDRLRPPPTGQSPTQPRQMPFLYTPAQVLGARLGQCHHRYAIPAKREETKAFPRGCFVVSPFYPWHRHNLWTTYQTAPEEDQVGYRLRRGLPCPENLVSQHLYPGLLGLPDTIHVPDRRDRYGDQCRPLTSAIWPRPRHCLRQPHSEFRREKLLGYRKGVPGHSMRNTQTETLPGRVYLHRRHRPPVITVVTTYRQCYRATGR